MCMIFSFIPLLLMPSTPTTGFVAPPSSVAFLRIICCVMSPPFLSSASYHTTTAPHQNPPLSSIFAVRSCPQASKADIRALFEGVGPVESVEMPVVRTTPFMIFISGGRLIDEPSSTYYPTHVLL